MLCINKRLYRPHRRNGPHWPHRRDRRNGRDRRDGPHRRDRRNGPDRRHRPHRPDGCNRPDRANRPNRPHRPHRRDRRYRSDRANRHRGHAGCGHGHDGSAGHRCAGDEHRHEAKRDPELHDPAGRYGRSSARQSVVGIFHAAAGACLRQSDRVRPQCAQLW